MYRLLPLLTLNAVPPSHARLTGFLVSGIGLGLVLLLWMPLVVTPGTLAPFVFGKAVYARSLILAVAALWLVLILWDPTYRPRRMLTLLVFALYVGAAGLSAVAGVSPAHSMWSSYSRMTGVWDLALWLLLAVVAASVLRTVPAWHRLLNWGLVVSLVLSLLAVSQGLGLDAIPGLIQSCRLQATLGNPSYLGAILVVTILLAMGFLVRSFLPATDESVQPAIPQGRPNPSSRSPTGVQAPGPLSGRRWSEWGRRIFWLVTAVLGLWVLFQTGTRGALLGLVAGAIVIPVGLIIWGNRKALLPAIMGAGGVLVLVVLLFAIDLTVGFPTAPGCKGQTASARLTELISTAKTGGAVTAQGSVGLRLAYIDAGLKAFRDRPVFGWGHANFDKAYDRYVPASVYQYGVVEADQAHNQPVEELATHGAVGAMAFAAMWLTILWAIFRRRREPGEEVLAYAVMGGLVGYFVQNLFLFDTPASMLFWVVLVSWVAGQERTSKPVPREAAPSSRAAGERMGSAGAATRRGPRWWPRLAVTVLVVLVFGLSLNYLVVRPLQANRTFVQAYEGPYSLSQRLELATESFDILPGMADWPRELMFDLMLENLEDLGPMERNRLAAFVLYETQRTLGGDPRNVHVVSSGIEILQPFATPEGLQRLDLLLEHLREHAPQRVYTHWLAANQEILRGNYDGAVQIAEQFEALSPWAPESIREIKRAAQEAAAGVETTGESQ